MSHVNVITNQKTTKVTVLGERPIQLVGGGHVATHETATFQAPPPALTPPVEILARIIELGASADADRLEFPILVSHICARFRDIALSTPLLWNHIDFVGGKSSYHDIEALLERSKQVSLSVTISKLDTPADAETMLRLLMPTVSRWKKLSLSVFEPTVSEIVMKALESAPAAPLLETMSIVGFSPSGSYNPFGGNTPRLRDLTVKSMPLLWSSTLFHSLESLYIHSQSFRDVSLLGNIPSLKSLVIRSDPTNPLILTFSSAHVFLPKLNTLELNGVTEEDIVRLMSHVEMPSLERLLFTHIKDSPNPVIPTIYPLMNVKTLRLHATEMCQDNLLSVLRKLRNLETISFEDSSPIPAFIQELTPTPHTLSEEWIIPSVAHFNVIAFEKDNAHRVYDDTDIAEALKVMMNKRQPVKEMRVRMCVFEGERDEVTRHAAPWDTERAYKSERVISKDS